MQGGYFIVNGSEKVLIAQERMANNHVYVFKKSQPSKFSYICECRCCLSHALAAKLDLQCYFSLIRSQCKRAHPAEVAEEHQPRISTLAHLHKTCCREYASPKWQGKAEAAGLSERLSF